MRKITIVLIAAAAVSAWGYGSLVSSFAAPAQYPNGVAYPMGTTSGFWVSCNGSDYRYRVKGGAIASSFANPGTSSMGCGGGFIDESGFVFVVDSATRYAYRLGMGSGSTYGSFSLPGSSPYGIDYCGAATNRVFYTDQGDSRLYYMDAFTGSVFSSYLLPFVPNDVGYDVRGYLWITNGAGSRVYQTTLAGLVLGSFSVSSYGYPAGCGCDGNYVYVGINAPLHSILTFETGGTGVTPASVGKVKALFR